tara:strand:- start:282 stop:1415 length:1134 start_codon:yes stop_codon:yes gene_type:complete
MARITSKQAQEMMNAYANVYANKEEETITEETQNVNEFFGKKEEKPSSWDKRQEKIKARGNPAKMAELRKKQSTFNNDSLFSRNKPQKQSLGDKIKGGLNKVGNTIGNTVGKARDTVKNAASSVADKAGNLANSAKEKVGNVASNLRDKVQGTTPEQRKERQFNNQASDFKKHQKAGTLDKFAKKYPDSQTAQERSKRNRVTSVMDMESYDPYAMVLDYLKESSEVTSLDEANDVILEMDNDLIEDILDERFGGLVSAVKNRVSGIKDKVADKVDRVKNRKHYSAAKQDKTSPAAKAGLDSDMRAKAAIKHDAWQKKNKRGKYAEDYSMADYFDETIEALISEGYVDDLDEALIMMSEPQFIEGFNVGLSEVLNEEV